jgi:hypothetical protein
MKADWILLGACAAITAYLMATDAPEPDAPEALTPVTADVSARAPEPVPQRADCSTNCSPDNAQDEHFEQSGLSKPGDCNSAPNYLQVECASALRDRASDPEFERSTDEPAN